MTLRSLTLTKLVSDMLLADDRTAYCAELRRRDAAVAELVRAANQIRECEPGDEEWCALRASLLQMEGKNA